MPDSIIPTQIGSTPPGSSLDSQVVIGKDTTVSFEAVGIGSQGRPDYVQNVIINLSKIENNTTVTIAKIQLNVGDLITLMDKNKNMPKNLSLALKEVAVCEIADGSEEAVDKRMIVLASDTYLPKPETPTPPPS